MTKEAAAKAGGPNTQSVRVTAVDLDSGYAVVRNSVGKEMPLSITVLRGPIPQVGELWLLDRTHGMWAFDAKQQSLPPTITGDREGADPIAIQVLNAMVALGFVNDQTTPAPDDTTYTG